ncbi:hypothetical protein BUALT_Bualt01G0230300 [Buddleja alternifolia]|uniref:RING-type E3 ubiquitin transferase n=1 Tax=Buddleja alternifolia TaxID=168488 RepID=A0AAV6YAC0_9LAMI|nr:hypothetical protein BUALT_Bualt01G0230300 [Buddleja alternifolia]
MGGCCCSSRKPQLHGTPVFYYYPSDSEEQESLTSHDSVATILPSGLLIDLNLNMSVPDTYRPPPAPIPYDVVLGRSQPTNVEPDDVSIMGEYDEENPKITTKCKHHFHLSCILEWMERSDTCPICDKEMIYEAL